MSGEGGCECGRVRYVLDGGVRDVIVCHCTECVAAVGRPWAASATHRRDLTLVESEGLRWRRSRTSAHGASYGVCERCRTVVFWDAQERDTVSFAVETLDEPPPLVVAAHIWVASDPDWLPPADDDAEGGIPAYPRGSPSDLAARWVQMG